MEANQVIVDIDILGETYKMGCDSTDRENTLAVGRTLNEKLVELSGEYQVPKDQQIALLVAVSMNLIGDLQTNEDAVHQSAVDLENMISKLENLNRQLSTA